MDPLIQLAIMWFGVFVASMLARKTRLTSVLYFLAFGVVMVNVGILPEETAPVIRGLAEIGIILIMFALGFEENTRNFLTSIKRSWGIAVPVTITLWKPHYDRAEARAPKKSRSFDHPPVG